MYAEVKKSFKDKKFKPEWQAVGKEFKDEYYNKKEVQCLGEDGYCWNEKYSKHPYDGRNYVLFGFLADVRNGSGFGGVDIGDRIEPIAETRGLPVDVSDYVKKQSDDWNDDGHSRSWFTLDELKKANWEQKITKRGEVSKEEYAIFKKDGVPKTWCGHCSGSKVINIDEKAYEKIEKVKGEHYSISIEWQTKLSSYCADFKKSMKALEKLLKYKNVLDVRVVFWFDN